jgi:peptide/nickel transport system substrate-binding protein
MMGRGVEMVHRYSRAAMTAIVAACAMAVAACSGSSSGSASPPGSASPGPGLAAVTPAGTRPVSSVVWATNRDVISLDPIFSAGYPEFTTDSLMCEALLRQAPDGALEPGLAVVSNPSPTTLVFTLRPGTTFWDGHPVTPADVVFSLDRAADPKLAGYYSGRLDRIASVAATSQTQVTVKLTQPDYWLEGELASMPGIVIEKNFAEKEGKNYGTPAGSIMCTGAYMLKSWSPGVGVVAVRNPHYWDPSVRPLVGQMTIKGVRDITSLTAGLLTGAIQGVYGVGLPTLDQLKHSGAVRVFLGPGWSSDMLEIASFRGVLGNLNVRRALSMALNRRGIIDSVYRGAAQLPRWLSNPGTFGYGKSVFTRAYDGSPVLTQDIAEARKLVEQAGDVGKTITFGTTSQQAVYAGDTAAYQAAAEAIGLKVALKSVPAQDYIDFFISPKARAGIDAFPAVDYGDYADPAAVLAAFELPGGPVNYDNLDVPPIVAALEQARGTANPDQRAALVARAEQLTVQQMLWIPDVEPDTVLVLGKGLTGAVSSTAYLFAPWADRLGGVG